MAMVKCKKCGSENPEYFMECSNCGYSEASSRVYEKKHKENVSNLTQEDSLMSLFDCSFNSFATFSIIKILYVLLLISAPVGCFLGISTVISLPITSVWMKIVFSIGVILAGLFELILARLVFETIVVIFRIEKNSRK